jgi:hypothetical protein
MPFERAGEMSILKLHQSAYDKLYDDGQSLAQTTIQWIRTFR